MNALLNYKDGLATCLKYLIIVLLHTSCPPDKQETYKLMAPAIVIWKKLNETYWDQLKEILWKTIQNLTNDFLHVRRAQEI